MIDRIYIPTYRRIKQPTWNNLPDVWKDKTVLVVDDQDFEKLKKNHNVMRCPVQGQGIPKVREWIMENARKEGFKFSVLDDDILDFVITRKDGESGLWNTRLSPSQFDDMFSLMSDWLDEVVTCGLEICWNPPISKMDKHICFRQTVNHFFNAKTFPFDLIDWNVELTEDYYMILQLLTNGFQNYISLRYRLRPDVTQATGGCATTRTIEAHNDSMEFIRNKFPDFVKLYEKTAKVGKEWGGKPKLAAEIAWKKAYKSSQVEPTSTLESFFV
jgi:hypothetical protein